MRLNLAKVFWAGIPQTLRKYTISWRTNILLCTNQSSKQKMCVFAYYLKYFRPIRNTVRHFVFNRRRSPIFLFSLSNGSQGSLGLLTPLKKEKLCFRQFGFVNLGRIFSKFLSLTQFDSDRFLSNYYSFTPAAASRFLLCKEKISSEMASTCANKGTMLL